jgi:hypothetical protein
MAAPDKNIRAPRDRSPVVQYHRGSISSPACDRPSAAVSEVKTEKYSVKTTK